MRPRFSSKILVSALFICGCCIGQILPKLHTFTPLDESNITILDLGYRFYNTTSLSCAFKCREASSMCGSFIHNQKTGECKAGSWLLLSGPSTQTVNDEKIYHSNNFCNTTDFTIKTAASYTYCIFVSTQRTEYITARAYCKARGGHLFTPKNAEKLKIMKEILDSLTTSAWFGLNDIVTEGDFRWEDDGTKIDPVWKKALFPPGEPSNTFNQEDCVGYFFQNYINDTPCGNILPFLCEIDLI